MVISCWSKSCVFSSFVFATCVVMNVRPRNETSVGSGFRWELAPIISGFLLTSLPQNTGTFSPSISPTVECNKSSLSNWEYGSGYVGERKSTIDELGCVLGWLQLGLLKVGEELCNMPMVILLFPINRV